METRVAVMGIIVEDSTAVEKLNALLHSYPISIDISFSIVLKSLELVLLFLISVSLCWISG